MKKSQSGFTLIETMIVLSVSSILLAITLPLSAFWFDKSDLSAAKGELSQGFGKAIALALRNEQALNLGQAVSALCLSDDNQLTVLEAASSAVLPNCAQGTGTSVWSSSLPEDISVTHNSNQVSCVCFGITGLPTSNDCPPCTTASTIIMSIGDERDTVHVR